MTNTAATDWTAKTAIEVVFGCNLGKRDALAEAVRRGWRDSIPAPVPAHLGGECWGLPEAAWCEACASLARREDELDAQLRRRVFAESGVVLP